MNSFIIPVKLEELQKLPETGLEIEIARDEVLEEGDLDVVARMIAEWLYHMDIQNVDE